MSSANRSINVVRAAWFHCFCGIAGDMTLASLVDAGADVEQIIQQLKALPIDNWSIESEPTQRCGLAATHMKVFAGHDHKSRKFSDIKAMLNETTLPARVSERAISVFTKLAIAEGKLHGVAPDDVHFHEVGSNDAIIDVVGSCVALELLDIQTVYSSQVTLGNGTISSAHGTLPNPAPAVVELLRGVPTKAVDIDVELTTPTGAAILSALSESFGAMPAFAKIIASGYGAGTKHIEGTPNCVQVVIGETDTTSTNNSQPATDSPGQPISLIEVNVDDMTGEVMADAVQRMLDCGALDAWITPIIMKRGRPAYTISALVACDQLTSAAQLLMRLTGSFGVRATEYQRWASQRDFATLDISGQSVGIKSCAHRTKVEYNDAARAAENLNSTVREVMTEAESGKPDQQQHPHDS